MKKRNVPHGTSSQAERGISEFDTVPQNRRSLALLGMTWGGMKKLLWFLISLAVLVLDQASKYWALKMLHAYEGVSVLPFLNWTLMFNTGAAFSFLDSAGAWHIWLFIGFSLLMSLVIAVWIIRKSTTNSFELSALSLILGGALGNLFDRFNHGYVIDFIDVFYKTHHWPAFNIADSAITLGGLVLLMGWAREKQAAVVSSS